MQAKEKKKEEINFIALLKRNTSQKYKKGYEDKMSTFFVEQFFSFFPDLRKLI